MKKTLVFILVLAMLLLVAAGCSTPATTASQSGSEPGTGTQEPTTAGPPAEIVYVFPLMAGEPVDLEKVNDAINEISIGTINVEVALYPISVANYSSQVPLMITGGEEMDLVETLPGGPTIYASMVAQNQLIDITDLAPEYAQDTIDEFNALNPDFLSGAYINGRMYGFPNLFDKVTDTYFDLRKDMLEETGMLENFKAVENMDDLEVVVKALSENSDIPVLCSTGNSWGQVVNSNARLINFDNFSEQIVSEFFGSDTWAYGAIVGQDNSDVINMYASDEYKAITEKARDWYLKDYISKDAATQVEMGGLVIKANGALGGVSDGELGHENYINSQTNHEMISVKVADAVVNTGIMQKFVWALPVSCSDEVAALKFLNLTYTNGEIVNLLNYGIAGEHYVNNADGTISLPEGITPESARYFIASPFLFGNAFLAKVVPPDPADLREQTFEINQNAKASPLLGFAVDTTEFTNEYTAVINVITQYSPGLNAGSSDPETTLPKFLSALDDAGMQTIIESVQAQVDAYLEAQ